MLKDYPPIELTIPHIQKTIADHVAAAKMAMECGFDGVEIHGGNGYLVDQFLNSNVNTRTDDYGGSPEKRGKFAVELVKAVGDAIGEGNVSLKLSPFGLYNDMGDEARFETWSALLKNLKKEVPEVSYVAFVEPRMEEMTDNEAFEKSWGKDRKVELSWAREILGSTPVMSAGGWDGENVWGVVECGRVDMCAFGRWFIANPDMPDR
jgi:2,4-dienoyl-CoA reductase-like NADH-dependent reductase (Old Yellow Enzyme family)